MDRQIGDAKALPRSSVVGLAVLAAAIFTACAGHGTTAASNPDGRPSQTTEVVPSSPSTSSADSRTVATAERTDRKARDDRSLTIVTGAERDTDFQTGLDLARYVAEPAGLDLTVLPSKGAADNMHRLHDEPKVDLAIVQYDVYKAFVDETARGSKAAAQMMKPMRVVAPLYTQEMYFIVRRDSDLRTVDQIRDRKINVGAVGSGSALTVAAVYRQLFNTPIAAGMASYLDEQKALVALTVDRTVDVVVVVAGQPMKLLAEMRPEARQFIKLLAVDPALPSSKAAFRTYFPATIRASSYSQWLDRDVPTLSVLSFLVTSTGKGRAVDAELDAFARSLCQNIDVLKERGHPKWREVDVTLKLGNGWAYSPVSSRQLEHCPASRQTAASSTTR